MSKVIEIFDAYREEADKAGRKATADDLCIRRQVVMLEDQEALAKRRNAFREFIKLDPRVDFPDRPAMLDSPSAHTFSIGDEEFIFGKADAVAEQIIGQCRRAGAGNFAALFDRMANTRPAHGLLPRFRRGNDSAVAQGRGLGSLFGYAGAARSAAAPTANADSDRSD